MTLILTQMLNETLFYDGPGVITRTHKPEEGRLCVVKRRIHTHTLQTQKYKYTKIQ